MLNTPVLFLIFNRLDTTKKVFDEIRKQKPKYLFVAARDRPGKQGEKEQCQSTRDIVSKIDWDCELKTLFRDSNLGSRYAVSLAINWFFEHVEEGIILEDDCLPNDSFFAFCTNMLERYRDDKKVMMITGTSYQTRQFNQYSYYFSKYVHVWGWATWKTAWELYDVELKNYDINISITMLKKTFSNKREQARWLYNFQLILNGLDAWDYQWMYCIWKNDGICTIPWKNMVANIGFGKEATHTFDESSDQSNMGQHQLGDIVHPPGMLTNKKADVLERYNIIISPLMKHLFSRITAIVKRILNVFKAKAYKNG